MNDYLLCGIYFFSFIYLVKHLISNIVFIGDALVSSHLIVNIYCAFPIKTHCLAIKTRLLDAF